MSFADRIRMGIDHMGGRVPFSPDALLYRVHHQDVVGAVDHIVRNELTGAFNICRQDVRPPTNKQVFDRICDEREWPRLEFLDAIRAPTREISAARIVGAGWSTAQTDYHFE